MRDEFEVTEDLQPKEEVREVEMLEVDTGVERDYPNIQLSRQGELL